MIFKLRKRRWKWDSSSILIFFAIAKAYIQDAQASVQEWRGKATTSRNKLNEAKANQSDDLSKSKVLKSLTHLKDGGKIDGFHVSNYSMLIFTLFW